MKKSFIAFLFCATKIFLSSLFSIACLPIFKKPG
jgi:hypothetical protein